MIEALEREGVAIEESELAMIPNMKTALTGEKAQEVLQLIEALEDSDDVQSVYHNMELQE